MECNGKFSTSAEALAHLRHIASSRNISPAHLRGIEFVFVERRSESTYPCREEYFVAAPAVVEEKARYGLPWFEAKWSSIQLRLGFPV
mgnify:CR=1 FL=1